MLVNSKSLLILEFRPVWRSFDQFGGLFVQYSWSVELEFIEFLVLFAV